MNDPDAPAKPERIPRPSRIKDITGNRYGMLVVLGISPNRVIGGHVLFDCRCDCGATKAIMGSNLKRGLSRSCGCQVLIAAHKPKPQMRTHGFGHTWVYGIWFHMVDRCYNPQNPAYEGYGGRGIRVCERWKNSVGDFYADMGDRPSPQHSIDRKDNDGDYEPGNCRWATKKEQANNRRSSRIMEFQGERLTISEWADRLGFKVSMIQGRLQMGWSDHEALSTPKKTTWSRGRRKSPKSPKSP